MNFAKFLKTLFYRTPPGDCFYIVLRKYYLQKCVNTFKETRQMAANKNYPTHILIWIWTTVFQRKSDNDIKLNVFGISGIISIIIYENTLNKICVIFFPNCENSLPKNVHFFIFWGGNCYQNPSPGI